MATLPDDQKAHKIINEFLKQLLSEFKITLNDTEVNICPMHQDRHVSIRAGMVFPEHQFRNFGEKDIEHLRNTLELVRESSKEAGQFKRNPSLQKAWNNYQAVKRLSK